MSQGLVERGLYKNLSIKSNYSYRNITKNLLSFLQYSDGKNDLNQIAEYLKISKKNHIKFT